MDSLPKQHIDSLTKDAWEDAYWKISAVCVLRGKRLPEDKVAEKAGFDSVEDMYFRLEHWGLPGLLPLKEGSKEEPPKRGEGVWLPEQRRRKSGPEEVLPPAAAAAPLFREVLESLKSGVENLRHRHEVLQDGQFAVTVVDTDSGFYSSGGASWAPPEPLPTLIAVYLLLGRPLEPLLEALNLRPAEVDRKRIWKLVDDRKRREGKRWSGNDGLRHTARKIAELVRGGEGRDGGKRPSDVLPLDHNISQRAAELWDAGASDEEICEKLRHRGYPEDEIIRLRKLGFRRPKT